MSINFLFKQKTGYEMRIRDWSSDGCPSDLLSAAPYLQEKLGGEMAIGREIVTVQGVFGKVFNEGTEFERDGSQFDRLLDDGDELMIGEVPLIALHVPGHTPADMAYIVGDAAFIGDTMFMPDYGSARADFPGGNARDRKSTRLNSSH